MNKYEVSLNWHSEIHNFYTYAPTKVKALTNAIFQLAEEVGMSARYVRMHIMEEYKNKFTVKLIKEEKE